MEFQVAENVLFSENKVQFGDALEPDLGDVSVVVGIQVLDLCPSLGELVLQVEILFDVLFGLEELLSAFGDELEDLLFSDGAE